MSSLNAFCFTGRAGRDPEIRHLDSGVAVTRTLVALNLRPRKGEEQPPIWVEVAMWGKRAQGIADYVRKGDLLAIHGELQPPDAWIDQQGNARVRIKVNANEIQFLHGPGREQSQQGTPAPSSQSNASGRNGGSTSRWISTVEEMPF